jgi:hypothetical protein
MTEPKRIVLFERADKEAPAAESSYRIWCNQIVERDNWLRIRSLEISDDAIELKFPADEFDGFPASLRLDVPKLKRLGGIWRLHGDGAMAADFMLRSDEEFRASKVTEAEENFERENDEGEESE